MFSWGGEGMGTLSWCMWGGGNFMAGDWLKGQQHICHQIKMNIHKHTKTSQLFPDSPFPGSHCVKKTIHAPHQTDTQNHSKQAPDSASLYYISQDTFLCGSHLFWSFSSRFIKTGILLSELSFSSRHRTVRRCNFDQLEKGNKTFFVIFGGEWLGICVSLPW